MNYEMYVDYLFYKIKLLKNNYMSSPTAQILMLHHVREKTENGLAISKNQYISPDTLDSFLCSCKERGFNFISMDELFNLSSTSQNSYNLVITIDDGYRDTYLNAFPIFVKNEIPFTFYVSSAFPEKRILLWWYYLEELILKSEILSLKNGIEYDCATFEKKQIVFVRLSKLILQMGKKINEDFSILFNTTYYELVEKYTHDLIGWEEIIEMNKNPLCTIGAHTENHYGLRFIDKEEVIKEFALNKNKLEERISSQVKHLAYPFGTLYSVGYREFMLAKKAGFATAVTTNRNKVFSTNDSEVFSLPRIELTESEIQSFYS